MELALETLEKRLGATWAAISAARAKTDDLISKLTSALKEFEDSNFSVVVTGSLGRGEATGESDADWYLLVDGQSNPDHAGIARKIRTLIANEVPTPVGSTETFGVIVPSHDLVHYIAGTHDTNQNLTRRILLLSESRALTGGLVRERVIRNVLARYVVHNRSVPRKDGKRETIPHFLLNDVVRYWRTMASDFASKMWEKEGDGWGIRNIKLRFSRKLLFIWGLLASFSGELFSTSALTEIKDEEEYFLFLAELIREQTDVSPLNLLARAVLEFGNDQIARDILSSYNEFLRVLSDPAERSLLAAVHYEDALKDKTYDHLRTTSRHFRDGVTALFFDNPKLFDLIKKYGVF